MLNYTPVFYLQNEKKKKKKKGSLRFSSDTVTRSGTIIQLIEMRRHFTSYQYNVSYSVYSSLVVRV